MRSMKASWQNITILGVLIGWTALCYASITHNSFVAEDFMWFSDADKVMSWVFFPGRRSGYRPVMAVFWFVGRHLWGDSVVAYRVSILVLHALNGWLVAAIAHKLSKRWIFGLAAGLLFIGLPTSAESVNWLSAATNQVTCGIGYFGSLLIYMRLHEQPPTSRKEAVLRYLACACALLIALASNEIALTWPFAALALAYHVRIGQAVDQNFTDGSRVRAYLADKGALVKAEITALLPLIGVWLTFIVWRSIAVRGMGVYGSETHLQAGFFLVQNIWVYMRFFIPSGFSTTLDSSYHILESNPTVALTACLVALTLCWRVRWIIAATLAMIAPALNIPALHRGYIGGAGCILIVILMLDWLSNVVIARYPRGRLVSRLAVLVIIAILFWVDLRETQRRNDVWIVTSDWVSQIIDETYTIVPNPQDGTLFYYAHLPTFVNYVNVFGWGLPQAIQLRYLDNTVHAYQVEKKPNPARIRYKLESDPQMIAQQSSHPQIFLVYQSRSNPTEPLIRRVSRDEFLRILEEETPDNAVFCWNRRSSLTIEPKCP